MYKAKVVLYNAQKELPDDGIEILSQKIVGINFVFESEGEQDYFRETKTKVFSPTKEQKIDWRDELWNSLSEEHIIISAEDPFSVILQEDFVQIEQGEKQEETNKLIQIDAKLEGFEDGDELWGIINKEDNKYAIVPENMIKRPALKLIKGGLS